MVKRSDVVGVQIVHHQFELWNVGVMNLQQIRDLFRPLNAGPLFANRHMTPSGQRLREQEDAARSVTKILAILPQRLCGFHGNRLPGLIE